MSDSVFTATHLSSIIQAMKQQLVLLSKVGCSLSSTQKWKKELIVRTDTQISEKCNSHQPQLAPGRAGITETSRVVASCSVLSLNVENHVWGDPLKQAGLEIVWQVLQRRLIFCCWFFASAAMSILVLECSRVVAPAFDTSQEDKHIAAFPCLGWVCSVPRTLQGGLGGFRGVIPTHPGKARNAYAL